MSLTAVEKANVVTSNQVNGKDTGSPEVQVALLTARIDYLTTHFKAHPKDEHSRRGLRHLVNMRRKLLSYLKGKFPQRYQSLISKLGLRG